MFVILMMIILVVVLIYSICIENKSKKILAERNKRITNSDATHIRYQRAIEQEKQSKNPKFHRTEKEEELSFQFETNHSDEIDKRVNSFEECYRLACAEKDLNKKIELLEKTIIKFEKSKNWFYHTKGGTIYFQDMYEHLHNSRNDDFSYIDQVKNDLNKCIKERRSEIV